MKTNWQGVWIADPRFIGRSKVELRHKELEPGPVYKHPDELKGVHMLVRHKLTLTEAPKQAQLDLTADDYYKLYINGRFVAQGPAQGFADHYFYNRLDVTQYLSQGENVIAVHVYYQGLLNRAFNSADFRQGMIAELLADGRIAAASGPDWRYRIAEGYGRGEPFGYDTQFPEQIDERLLEAGWREREYDDGQWLPAQVDPAAGYTLAEQPTPPLSVYLVKPADVRRLGPGRYWLDFGQEVTGQITMRAKGEAGQVVNIYCGEELEADGTTVRYRLRANCVYHDAWTLSGREDTLELYDYKAFRYAEIAGPETALKPDTFAAVVRHYPYDDEACRFSTSEPMLDAVWRICANGVKYGAHEQYVDCPSREKGQYLGDNTVIGHTHLYVSGDARLFRKAIEDTARSSRTCAGLMAVSPGSFMQEIADFSLQWPYQVFTYYRYTGDREFVREMLPFAERMLEHFRKYERADGLLEHVSDKWNLVDWPHNLRDDYDFPLTKPIGPGCHNAINAFYYGARATVRELRSLVGLPITDGEELDRLRGSYLKAFLHAPSGTFMDSEGSLHASLHANALPLFFGLVPDSAKPSVVGLLKRKRMSCGVYMAYFFIERAGPCGRA